MSQPLRALAAAAVGLGCGSETSDEQTLARQPPPMTIACDAPFAVPVPAGSGDSLLYGLKSFGPTAFAVGYYWDTTDVCDRAGTRGSCIKPLVASYASGDWSYTLPPPPLPGGPAGLVNSYLYAVDGSSATDVWAVGSIISDESTDLCVVAEDCPNWWVLDPGMPANAPRHLRACGATGRCMLYSDLIYHFDGRAWTRRDTDAGAKVTANALGPFLAVHAFATDSVDFFGDGFPLDGYG